MADSRRKTHSILLNKNGKTISIELYDAALWPDYSSTDGLYRLRIDGKWYCPAGKYSFVTMDVAMQVASKLMLGRAAHEYEQAPPITAKQRVRVHTGECVRGLPIDTEQGHIVTPPMRDITGTWHLWVLTSSGLKYVPVHDVEIGK